MIINDSGKHHVIVVSISFLHNYDMIRYVRDWRNTSHGRITSNEMTIAY